jgi:hypothetical protein
MVAHSHKDSNGYNHCIHGYVGVYGPKYSPRFFTGVGFSAVLNAAKVFSTTQGCMRAMSIWQHADYTDNALTEVNYATVRAAPIVLNALVVDGLREGIDYKIGARNATNIPT